MKEISSKALRKTAAVAAGIGLVAGGAHEVKSHLTGYHPDTPSAERVAALKNANTYIGKVIVVKSGANLRLTPTWVDESKHTGVAENIAAQIPKGKELVINQPIVDSSNPDWVGFTKPGAKDIDSVEELAANTYWVDASELKSQGKATISDGNMVRRMHIGNNGNIVPDRSNEFMNTALNQDGEMQAIPKDDSVGHWSIASSDMQPANGIAQVADTISHK